MEHWVRERFCPSLPLNADGSRATASREHIEISKKVAEEGTVLLKNEGGLLPLPAGARVALFGKATVDFVKGGGGSGDVTVPYVRNLVDGFRQIGDRVHVFPDTIPFYETAVKQQYAEGFLPGMTKEPEIPADLLQKAAAYTDTAIFSLSRFSGEGWDRRSPEDVGKKHSNTDERLLKMSDAVFERGDFYLSDAEERALTAVEKTFPKVIVVLNIGGIIAAARFAEDPGIQAVLLPWQGGMEGGLAEAEVLSGLAEPSGRLADTFMRDLSDVPSTKDFLKSEDVLDYSEDIYVGYRYFETIPGAKDKVVYPFGYGLSYTTFDISSRKIEVADGEVRVQAVVTNTGSTFGRETVQVYVGAPQGKLGKPARVLAGYRKTRRLAPGESETVQIAFPVRVFASYDDLGKVRRSAWVLEPGRYVVLEPYGSRVSLSRKISCKTKRKELREWARELLPDHMGVVLRTAAAHAEKNEIRADLEQLLHNWDVLLRRSKVGRGPGLLYRELDLSIRLVRDYVTDQVEQIIVDDEKTCTRLQEMLRDMQHQM